MRYLHATAWLVAVMAVPPPGAGEDLSKLQGGAVGLDAEEWAYLQYQVGKGRKVVAAKAVHASSPAVAARVTEETLAGRSGMQFLEPGSYRVFYFEAPGDRPGVGDERIRKALAGLKVPVGAGVASGAFALRLELAASGELLDQRDLFSTAPGLSDELKGPVATFLDARDG